MHKYFNPYKNKKCLEWALENEPEFIEQVENQEIQQCKEAFSDLGAIGATIQNSIGCHDKRDKAARWANKNFKNLEFCFETSHGYWTPKLGTWRNSDENEPRKGGIFVASIPLSEEIELQTNDGEFVYHHIGPTCLNILAGIA